MARKKRGKSGKKGFRWLGSLVQGMFRFGVKILPPALVFSLAGYLAFGVRQFLYADSSLHVREVHVEPAGALARERQAQLETDLI